MVHNSCDGKMCVARTLWMSNFLMKNKHIRNLTDQLVGHILHLFANNYDRIFPLIMVS